MPVHGGWPWRRIYLPTSSLPCTFLHRHEAELRKQHWVGNLEWQAATYLQHTDALRILQLPGEFHSAAPYEGIQGEFPHICASIQHLSERQSSCNILFLTGGKDPPPR
ncbi:unnamed protein product [Urochloa humidicola]